MQPPHRHQPYRQTKRGLRAEEVHHEDSVTPPAAEKALVLAAATFGLVAGALAGAAPAPAATSLPCDIYAAAGTPCVAAHSTVRALYAAYTGSLYQVRRASDGTTLNVGTLAAGGYANAAAQNSFCAGTSCTITEIFDQSANHNNLTIEGPGGNGGQDVGANAAALPVTAGGHQVYGVFVTPGVGYRNNATTGVATGSQPQGAYMVASGSHVNGGCCFDYGNAETNSRDNGNGHMDAINFSTECWFAPCLGTGPWVQADLENGLFAGAMAPTRIITATTARSSPPWSRTTAPRPTRSRAATRRRAASPPGTTGRCPTRRLRAHAPGRRHHPRHRRR